MKETPRKHSRLSASATERWFNCSGSVALSEGIEPVDNVYSIEGTRAHSVLEDLLASARARGVSSLKFHPFRNGVDLINFIPVEMYNHAVNAANFVLGLQSSIPGSELFFETKIDLAFIHPEMFGTFDSCVVDHFGTLHVIDFKYGKKKVSPIGNTQMIFYGLGMAAKYDWNFKRVRLWIIQPRVSGYTKPTFWEMTIFELKAYVKTFTQAVKRVERYPTTYTEGSWCWFCPARLICPLKADIKMSKAKGVFENAQVM